MKARLATLALLCLAAACGDDSGTNNNSPSAVAYAGTFGSTVSSGTIVFSTAPATLRATGSSQASLAVIDLVGNLTFSGGGTLDLTGTLDNASLVLQGLNYQFTGTLSGKVIGGTFTGPNGETGTFSATLSSGDAAVKLFCGRYAGTDNGVFSLALAPDRTGGVIVVPSNGSGGLTGRSKPDPNFADAILIYPDAAPTQVIASGDIFSISNTTFDSVDGIWNTGSDNGTFGGSTRCQ